METAQEVYRLKELSRNTRKLILESLAEAGSGYAGSSLSAVEILVTLYFEIMRYDPNDPSWPGRDRFYLSKGQAAPLLYAVLAQAGFFPAEELMTLGKIGSRLQGNPSMGIPGVEAPAGSEGIGLSLGVGTALAARLDKKGYRTYVLMGDGEQQEGQVWEAAMTASKYGLDHLTAIVDRNGIQQDGLTEQIMPIEPLAAKWRAFNWSVIELDGYDFLQLLDGFDLAARTQNMPTVIIAHTVKGKGISFMEWSTNYHGAALFKEKLSDVLNELEE